MRPRKDPCTARKSLRGDELADMACKNYGLVTRDEGVYVIDGYFFLRLVF